MVVAATPFVPRKRNLSEQTRENIRVSSRAARAKRKLDGLCVNHHAEPRPRTHGCRCFECWLVHRLKEPTATSLLDSSVMRCIGCELRVPTGYGEFVDDVGMFHKRCAEQLYEKGSIDGNL